MRKKAAAVVIMVLLAGAIQVLSFKSASANPSSWHIWSPPELAILSPLQNGTYSESVPLSLKVTTYMKGWSMEEMTNLSYSLDGKQDVMLSSYSYGSDSEGITLVVSDILSGLTDGQHTLVVNGLTNWHNAFNSTVTFTVDTSTIIWGKEPPRIFIISPKNETYTNFDTALPLNFSVNEPFVWAKLSLDKKANQTINGNMTIDSSNFFAANSCCHSVKVYAIDTAGNIGASDTIYFTMVFVGWSPQPLPPIAAIISPQNDTYFKSDVPLRFTIDKTIPLGNEFLPTFTNISRISYRLDGENEVTIHGNTTLTGLPDGAHNVIVFAKDTLGNIGVSQTIFFTTKAGPFPTTLVTIVSAAIVVTAGAGFLVYFKKRKVKKPNLLTDRVTLAETE